LVLVVYWTTIWISFFLSERRADIATIVTLLTKLVVNSFEWDSVKVNEVLSKRYIQGVRAIENIRV
jgi:hypothetical protein